VRDIGRWGRALSAAVCATVLGAGLVACAGSGLPAVRGQPPAARLSLAAPPVGTPGWQLTHPGPEHAIEGYADHTSVVPGQPVRLFVSTTAVVFTVTAWRMGAYSHSQALQVWASAPQPGERQPPPVVMAPTSTVVAPWRPSLTVPTDGWAPGDYLLRLDGQPGGQQFVALTVRTPSNTGLIVVVNAVTTWQAYNRWGGYSLYDSPSGRTTQRSRAVSFDRPYQANTMQGAGDFLYFELPFVTFAEQQGLPLGYATDLDLHADPHLLEGARAVVTLGHDEYWSQAMREHATAARDRGVNLAFLGGNEIYRHIRLTRTSLGPDRLEVDYKSFTDDPLSRTDPAEATPQWRQPPLPRPESVLLGNYYQCNPTEADLVVANPDNWLLSGLVAAGERLPRMVGNEYEKVDLSVPTPRPIEVLFHSPLTCQGRRDFADTSYYTVPGGAAVFSSGTQYWICGLDPGCARAGSAPTPTVRTISAVTTRLLQAFAQGPAGLAHPAQDNLTALHIGAGTTSAGE